MKTVWVKADPWNKRLVTEALEANADAVMVPEGKSADVKKLGRILTIAPDGDLKPGEDVVFIEIKGAKDESKAIKEARDKKVVVSTTDWTIIPLENLVAQADGLIAAVKDAKQARTAMGILEKGVSGVLLDTTDPREVRKVCLLIKEKSEDLKLAEARISEIRTLAMGDRVCVDTCSNMGMGQGMLVGNSSAAMFLIHAESLENPYVEPRPFRVNAGPVHAYVRMPGGRTSYLSEIKAGDEILLTSHDGSTETAVVGRIKMEKRPLLFIQAEAEGNKISTIVQNAETIRLVRPGGEPVSVAQVKEGDTVLVYLESAGRHFGHKVDETIVEK
jgi:3-dehydroquinate synthase II